ncbi:hypothetical protein KCP77_15390 [Salmonella enterica subsp. enterica]|nr:hypothetical protein KCP77_15390 [Salmonella enterica subsp. enterica]
MSPRARVCEVIVGILCGGMILMILPSIGWHSPPCAALKQYMRACWNIRLLAAGATDAIRSAHRVIGQILTARPAAYSGLLECYRFSRRQECICQCIVTPAITANRRSFQSA